VVTLDLAEMVRKMLDESKGSTFDFVILSLSIGQPENINNTKSIVDVSLVVHINLLIYSNSRNV
jgi:hypothetical protein